MPTYYLDPAADFTDQVGTGKAGTEYTGPGGFQAAIRGTGAATALAAGDTLVIKAGTLAMDRMVLFNCGVAVNGWGVGDAVQNGDDDGGTPGAEWTGVVVQPWDESTTGLNDTTDVIVQLDSTYTIADVDDAEGIENTDAGGGGTDPTTSGITGSTMYPTTFDSLTPTSTLPVDIIGCSSAWTEKGATNGTIIDGSVGASTAANLWSWASGTQDYMHLWNLTFQNCSGVPILTTTGFVANDWFIHCKFDSIAGVGIPCTSSDLIYAILVGCIFSSNSGNIYMNANARIINCVFRDNSGSVAADAACMFWGCVGIDNTELIALSSYSAMINCVIDGTDQATDDLLNVSNYSIVVMGSRFVNAPAGSYGILSSATRGPTCYEDYNVFYNPLATGDLQLVTPGANSINTATSGEDGMDANWNVEDGKHHDSTEIILNWDA